MVRYIQKYITSKKGFTLMELMIVIVLLGFLIMAVLGTYISSQIKGRDSKRKADMANAQKALELYHNDKGEYPDGDGDIEGCEPDDITACTWGDPWRDQYGTYYMVTTPLDPRGGSATYYYDGVASGINYKLYGRLENEEDVDIDSNVEALGIDCGHGDCNYGISSLNVLPY